jgi:hypothetical protein
MVCATSSEPIHHGAVMTAVIAPVSVVTAAPCSQPPSPGTLAMIVGESRGIWPSDNGKLGNGDLGKGCARD